VNWGPPQLDLGGGELRKNATVIPLEPRVPFSSLYGIGFEAVVIIQGFV